ncbi:thiamine diphosphokinase [Maritalea myrionectae]|uniref:thiamine diphosphokinase n=1 Tax=Maritalea myrionectae TaxID=454601 RepID=UPI000426E835|nr:thiamine diphosphokinase [Maritalea myrionectae]
MRQDNHVFPELEYDTPVVVLGGGFVEIAELQRLVAKGYPVVAADGAAHVALAAGVPIAAIIGDMDSYVPVHNLPKKTQIVHVPEQATTDFEKCLYRTKAPTYICLGMIGKRFDHSLAALHAAQKYGQTKKLILVDETDVIAVISGPVSFDVPVETRISVYPLSAIEMDYSKGLAYPLDGLCLAQGDVISTSNCAVEPNIEIVPHGDHAQPYLLILPNQFLDVLTEIEMSNVSAPRF